MKVLNFTPNVKQIVLLRHSLKDAKIDIEGRTIIIGFNEPKFKILKKDGIKERVDSKLNARFITYFLPAIEVARMQKNKSRFFIVSAINMALKWNAETEEDKKIMMADNAIKLDFVQRFFEHFFREDFSLIEYVIPQDILKVPEEKFLALWKLIERKYPAELEEIRFQLTKFIYPRTFNVQKYEELTKEQKKEMQNLDISVALKYAIGHLFGLGDINFEGNYIHNPQGYVSIGFESEKLFNVVRDLAFETVKDFGELIFDREVTIYENYRIVLENEYKTPPAYNGASNKHELLEMTYENERDLSFYDNQEKLKDQMDYVYENLLSREEYQVFWDNYRSRYFDLKERYREAYNIQANW